MRTHLGVHEADLTGDDYAATQAIANAAREAGFDAVLAPSAALGGRTTLAVFARALDLVTPDRSEIRQTPTAPR